MKKKMLFIYNPHAGKGVIKNKLSDVIEIFSQADYEVMVYPTRKSKDAKNITIEKGKDFDYIVCSGGDGTLNELTSGIMELKKGFLQEGISVERLPICGYLPTGTVNDFASSLKIPKDIVKAAEIVVNGENFPYDIGSLNNDYFNYVAAFGAFTEVAYETPQTTKNMLGRLAYVLDGAKRLPNITSYHMVIECDGNIFEDDFIFGMITNSNSIGGFKGLNGTNVSLDDGLFETAFIKMPKTPLELQSIMNALLMKELETPYIYSFLTDKIKITSTEKVAWTVDGEYGGSYHQVELTNHKQAIVYRRGISPAKSE